MNKNLNVLGSFFSKNYKTLLFLLFGLFLTYWVIFVITPSVTMSNKEKTQIDSLNVVIQGLHKENLKLDSTVLNLNNEIKLVDKQIEKLKNKKVTIKKEYHEKITRVDNYTDSELDSFFSDRYK